MIVIPISGTITEAAIDEFISSVEQVDPADEIHVVIDSQGGSVFAATKAIAVLDARPGRVVTIVRSGALSAAAAIFQAGDERRMHPDALLMIHSPLMDNGAATIQEHEQAIQILKTTETMIARLFARTTGHPENRIREWMTAELWLDATEAVRLRFADSVIEPTNENFPLEEQVMNQSNSQTPATLQELRNACPSASNDFLIEQLDAGATVSQAQTELIRQLNAKASVPGVQPLGGGNPNRRGGGGGGQREFHELVDSYVAKGMPRARAVVRVGKDHPELREQLLIEANPHLGSADIERMIHGS